MLLQMITVENYLCKCLNESHHKHTVCFDFCISLKGVDQQHIQHLLSSFTSNHPT